MSSSDSDEDNVIRYGTPLEPYEEDEISSKRKYQQPTDQYAVDSYGKRRFHGAFTGGFSAGFGNTVGSQEGWTPTTFKSSRSEKAQGSSQRPEDFMDEEDRSEFGIAPKEMQTRSEFSGHKRSRQMYHDGPIPGEPALEQLIEAVHETAAVRILRDMGWRPGQGTGDRVTRREKRKAKEQQKVYGCYMPEELKDAKESEEKDSDQSSDSEFEYNTLFAPDDYEPYILNRKNDRFGLGYQGLSRHSVLGNMMGDYREGSSKSHLKMEDKGKKVSIRGQAFGVGAFEADDEDIYGTEDMSHYDFAIGGPTQAKLKLPAKEKSNNVLEGFTRASKPLPPLPSHPAPALPRDYTPAAAGARRTRFSAIDAPQRDQGLGRHELTANARGALLGEPSQAGKQTDKPTNEDLIAKIVGRNVNFVSTNTAEIPIVISDTNNDDSLSTNRTDLPINDLTTANNSQDAADNNLASSNNKVVDFTTPNKRTVDNVIDFTAPKSDTPDYISIKDSGKEFSKVFKPFASNPLKQVRYENYLKDSTLDSDSGIDRLSEWEKERELMEFEQAAKLYKPLTGIMGDRFTHASEPDDATNPLTAVSKSNINYGLATPEQIAAAEKGVYGLMTRSTAPWRPEGLVYKRFNVPDPGGARMESKKADKPKVSYSIFSYLESSVHDKDSFTKEQTKFSGSKSLRDIPVPSPIPTQNLPSNETDNNIVKNTDQPKPIGLSSEQSGGSFKRMTVAELFMKESEKSKEKGQEVTDTIEKFDKMDLYKSIFLSDSEDELNEEGVSTDFNIINDFVEAPKNVQRNTSPPRGIFANIDFDELNSWKRSIEYKKPDSSSEKLSTDNKESNSASCQNDAGTMAVDAVYGPRIPDSLQKRLESTDEPATADNKKIDSNKDKGVIVVDSTSSDSWVEVKEHKDKEKKKKKKSKHKKDKHKHKKSKHKKKDR